MKKVIGIAFMGLLSLTTYGQKYQSYGEAFKATAPIPATALSSDKIADKEVIEVKGEVTDVCQAAGCWMKLKLADGQTMRVTFKDYGFFVPKDLAGTSVVIKGEPKVTTTSVADLKHYAADAGKSKEEIDAITASKTEFTFVANGVLVPKK